MLCSGGWNCCIDRKWRTRVGFGINYSQLQRTSLIKHREEIKSSVLFSNDLWRTEGDRKPLIKASRILSLWYFEAATLWKLQSLLSVFWAWRYSSSISWGCWHLVARIWGATRFHFEVSQKVLVISLWLLHSRCTPQCVERLRETRNSPEPRACEGLFVVGHPNSYRTFISNEAILSMLRHC